MPEKIAVWILGDQLMADHPALVRAEEEADRENIHILMVESQQRMLRHPYQAKKLVLLLSAMRHYAGQLRSQGYQVEIIKAPTFIEGLQSFVSKVSPDRLVCMAANDYWAREFQQKRLEGRLGIPVTTLPNTLFLVEQHDPYPDTDPDKSYRQEYFYRKMRRHFQILMDGDEPAGGQWNYDKLNRQPLPEGEQAPDPITFQPDAMTREVMAEVGSIDGLTGTVDGFNLAVTRQEALQGLDDFIKRRLAKFGPYEDAMTHEQSVLYHSYLSAYLNLGLLKPMELIRAAEEAYEAESAPINSVEGFIRQVLGWREFMYWQFWRLMPDLEGYNFWDAQRPLPAFFWDGQTEMNCLKTILQRAIEDGYNHHIERLMVLSNYCLLSGIAPREVNTWFLAHYIDAYDWVMWPNVIGMGLNADGGLIASKPYIASANYINKMGDYCQGCRFNHRQRMGDGACPFNYLYWNFLIQHEETLRSNPRLGPNVLGLRHLDEAERQAVQEDAARHLDKTGGF